MAWLHRHLCGDVSGKSVSPDPLGADHAPGGVLCAAGSARPGAGGAGGSAGHGARSASLVWDRPCD